MASTSASSIQKSFKYDVFLSFRGEDTRKNFIDHLYHALQQKGINTYKDDVEINKGKKINEELIRSIEDSKFYIIVFSKNYASSSWCLDELVKIMDCQKTNEQTAYPVFYDVEPTEVRKQSGAVGEAFTKHKGEESAEKWRGALREAADLAGWELKTTFDGHEAEFIQKIVKVISLELSSIDLRADGKLIGMDTRVRDVISLLEMDTNDVRMIGIKGIGGGGKTTLARVVFDQISFMFEGSSFVENVREVSKGTLGGLQSLQKKILSDVLHDSDIIVNGVSDLKKMLCGRKVFVVLDDVDHINQLEALAGELNWFKPGSRIIITTREEQVLAAHGVLKNLILNVNLLSHEEATCLFNKYAFGRVIPNQGYDMLSNQVVTYAAGLPLTLKVLGSSLRGNDELVWKSALERLKTIPLKETMEILEFSYENLEEDYKKIFLDVACFLKGWHKEEAITALESRGFYARNGLIVLEQKSLISVSETECLNMHDHLEEMGKNVVRRLHPNEPSRHTRLWNQDEIEGVLAEDKVRFTSICMVEKTNTNLNETTRGIQMWITDPSVGMKGLRKMKELEFLHANFSYEKYSIYLPNSLQYLRLDGYIFKCLPPKFQAKNLVGLNMHDSHIDQLWKRKVLKKLRFIDMSFCKLRSLDIGLFPNLERLSLVECDRLVKIHIPFQNYSLTYLNLSQSQVRTLDLEQAQNLDTLKVEESNCLTELCLPVETSKLKHLTLQCLMLKTLNITRYQNLETLHLICHAWVELPSVQKLKRLRLQFSKMSTLNLTQAQNLESLHLLNCKDMLELHMPVESFKLKTINILCSRLRTLDLTRTSNLERLDLEQCEDLEKIHMPIKSPQLESIRIRYCYELETLNLIVYQNLKGLDLEQCKNLVELYMPIRSPKLKTININYSKLTTLNLTATWNLESLYSENCDDLVELHMPIESPQLETIKLHCSKLKVLNLTRYQNLKNLYLFECENLLELHMPIESPKLKIIDIQCSKLRTLNLIGYQNLERLALQQCDELVELHMPIKGPKLNTITILFSKLRTLNLTGYQNLEGLTVEQCDDLVEFHMPIESRKLKSIKIHCSKLRTLNLMGIQNLEELALLNCDNLVELHMPIESSKLQTLELRCYKLQALNLTRTWNLEWLDIEQCDNLVELHMPLESPEFKTIRIRIRCSKLRTFDLTGTQNLEALSIFKCEDLVELHMPIESPNLKTVEIRCCKLRTLDLSRTRNLEWLNLEQYKDLVELHMPIESPELNTIRVRIHCSKLRTLDLTGTRNIETLGLFKCEDLVELLMPIESPELKIIYIRCSKLRTLNLSGYHNIETLKLEQCEDLEELQMPIESRKLKIINIRCSKLRTLYLGIPPYLKRLNLHDCYNLVEFHAVVGRRGSSVKFKPFLANQGIPMTDNVAELHLTVTSVGICSLHPANKLPKFHVECFYKDLLASMINMKKVINNFSLCDCEALADLSGSICGLQRLRKLTIEGSIPEVPKEIEQLKDLEELTLLSTNVEHLPDSICMLKHLKVLQLKSCCFLKKLPTDLGILEYLEELCITECTSLQNIPDSICEMKRLNCFHLVNCIQVEKLPKKIGGLKCLKELNIQGTGIRNLPQNIFQLEDLVLVR